MKKLVVTATLALVAALGFAPAGNAADSKPKKKGVIISTTYGFRHSCIPLANKVLQGIADKSGAFTLEVIDMNPNDAEFKGPDGKTDNAKFQAATKAALAKLTAEGLKQYDLIIFNSTTGQLPLPDKAALLEWVRNGGAFVGTHAATDTFHSEGEKVSPYIEMIGGEFKTHGPQVQVDIINQDAAHAACQHLPAQFTIFDEIYEFKNFERPKVHGLLGMDKHPQNKSPGDYPVSWCKQYGQGRVFYTSLGHREDVWDPEWKDNNGKRKVPPADAQAYQKHLQGGILWTLQLAPGSAEPGNSFKP
jgi:type 1 glutamine amidotransferase